METRLTKLMNKYQSDKGTAFDCKHGYTEIYDAYFSQYSEPRILEIGVFKGGDIMAFNQYYDGDCQIVGVDIDPNAGEWITDDANYTFYIADQGSREDLDTLCNKEENFDIIIDDGSHCWNHQLLTLYKLHKKVKQGGIFILEDLHTSFNGGGSYWNREMEPTSPLEFLIGIKDDTFILTPEEVKELREHIANVAIYSIDNPHNALWDADFHYKSVTAIITFK